MTEVNKEAVATMIENMLKYDDFCEVVVDGLEDDGISKGDFVYIAGTQGVPNDKDDIYNLRLKMLVVILRDNHVVSDKFYIVDATSLERVSEVKDKLFRDIMEDDFDEGEEDSETLN